MQGFQLPLKKTYRDGEKLKTGPSIAEYWEQVKVVQGSKSYPEEEDSRSSDSQQKMQNPRRGRGKLGRGEQGHNLLSIRDG